jgi:hypothetical protein
MMIRNLSNEIVRRRLWPIPLLAVLVAIAAPVFFLKPSPPSVPADAAATAAPAPGKLPARAARLLAATGATTAAGRATGTARDPFAPPSGHAVADPSASGAAAPKDSAKSSGSGSGSGSSSAAGSGSGSGSAAPATTPAAGTTTTTTPASPATTTHALTIDNASVDVRFGARPGGHVHRSVPRLQPYYIHGKLAAVFVKYSPSRHRAVFAVSPNLIIGGPVKCRRVAGVCRYLDIPAGSYARLTMLTADRYPVTRRLDVVKIGFGGDGSATTATVANDRGATACLLEKLHAQKPGAAAIDRDACAS